MQSKEAIAQVKSTGLNSVTDWNAFNQYGAEAYRIHFGVNAANQIIQAHEWKMDNGTVEKEGWIVARSIGRY